VLTGKAGRCFTTSAWNDLVTGIADGLDQRVIVTGQVPLAAVGR